jgi:hypothetical protein
MMNWENVELSWCILRYYHSTFMGDCGNLRQTSEYLVFGLKFEPGLLKYKAAVPTYAPATRQTALLG